MFKEIVGADGSVERHKARLVAQEFSQKCGIDCDKIFRPVVRQESHHVLIALSVQHEVKMHRVDVTTAFFLTIQEEVSMKQPEGFEIKGKEHLVCKLKKIIYGLKQSPHSWNVTLDIHLKEIGFIQSRNYPCIYYKNTEGEKF